jgi:hypothetical protein
VATQQGREVFEAIDKRTLGLGGAALLVALIFTGLLWAFRPDAILEWLMTLAATFISVVFAVALFWYQREKSDEARATPHLARRRSACVS